MHELSIASQVIETVITTVDQKQLGHVKAVVLKIGLLTDVVPDSLAFGFDALKSETILKDTELIINTITIKGKCGSCESNFEVKEYNFCCPKCESFEVTITEGKELDIEYLEVDD